MTDEKDKKTSEGSGSSSNPSPPVAGVKMKTFGVKPTFQMKAITNKNMPRGGSTPRRTQGKRGT